MSARWDLRGTKANLRDAVDVIEARKLAPKRRFAVVSAHALIHNPRRYGYEGDEIWREKRIYRWRASRR